MLDNLLEYIPCTLFNLWYSIQEQAESASSMLSEPFHIMPLSQMFQVDSWHVEVQFRGLRNLNCCMSQQSCLRQTLDEVKFRGLRII